MAFYDALLNDRVLVPLPKDWSLDEKFDLVIWLEGPLDGCQEIWVDCGEHWLLIQILPPNSPALGIQVIDKFSEEVLAAKFQKNCAGWRLRRERLEDHLRIDQDDRTILSLEELEDSDDPKAVAWVERVRELVPAGE